MSAVGYCQHFAYVSGQKPRVAGYIYSGADVAAFEAELLKLCDFHFTPRQTVSLRQQWASSTDFLFGAVSVLRGRFHCKHEHAKFVPLDLRNMLTPML
jgi:hypothetical protein